MRPHDSAFERPGPQPPSRPPLAPGAPGGDAQHHRSGSDPMAEAQTLISKIGSLHLPQVFKRDLALTSRRLADPDSSPEASPTASPSNTHASPPHVSPTALRRWRASYQLPDSPPPQTTATHAAAAVIQAAWHRYRLQTSRSFSAFGGEALRLVQRFISGSGFTERAASKAHLVLHFDINKTILMSDAAKGAGQADMVNMLISECAWGRMTVGPTWVPVGRLATDRPEKDPQLMTYRNFLDSFLYPYVEGSGEGVLAENVRRKKLCGTLQKTFTAPGQPGEMFVGVFHALAARLGQPDAEAHPLFASGQRRILPSFFELLLHLQASGRSFTVVFRTFGTDLREVIEEMNLFATGRHPSYPGVRMDGSDGRTDLRLDMPRNTGAFFRWGHKPEDTLLALGVDERALEAGRMSRKLLEDAAVECGGAVVRGFRNIHRVFHELALPPAAQARMAAAAGSSGASAWVAQSRSTMSCALAIRDYYHFWKSRNEFPRAGKLLLDDPEDTDLVQMFFDDNIGHTSAHIADARDVRTGESLQFSRVRNAQLNRAEPVNAILDPKYFVRAVSQCELNILRSHERAQEAHVRASQALPEAALPFSGPALAGLRQTGKSGVARTSLQARHRWEAALRKVLIMNKVVRAWGEVRM